MADKREAGFWWVRWNGEIEQPSAGKIDRWQVVEVSGEYAIFGDVYESVADPEIEWGPYLGTAPWGRIDWHRIQQARAALKDVPGAGEAAQLLLEAISASPTAATASHARWAVGEE